MTVSVCQSSCHLVDRQLAHLLTACCEHLHAVGLSLNAKFVILADQERIQRSPHYYKRWLVSFPKYIHRATYLMNLDAISLTMLLFYLHVFHTYCSNSRQNAFLGPDCNYLGFELWLAANALIIIFTHSLCNRLQCQLTLWFGEPTTRLQSCS